MSIYHFDSLDSTNSYIKFKYRFLDDFSIVYVDYQNKGRGRNNNVWESSNGKNLLCSFLLKDKANIKYPEGLSLLTGVVIYKLLTKLKIKDVSIKWPNDVYVKNKKICGILCESICNNNNIEAIVLGIGLNLNQMTFPDNLNATSYAIETDKFIKIDKVLNKLSSLLKKELFRYNIKKSDYLDVINSNNFLKNKTATATINGKKETVIVQDINSDNTLNVILNGGKAIIRSDEVTLTL